MNHIRKSLIRHKIAVVLFLAVLATIPAYGQTVNCPNGCTIVVTPDSQPQQTQTGTGGQQYGPSLGGFNLGGAIQNGLQAIQNFFTGLEGSSIPSNNYVNKTGIQNATGAGFDIIGDLFKTGFDTSTFIADLINSFELFHVSFWIVTVISMVVTMVLIIRSGEEVIKRILLVLAIVAGILAVLWLLFVYLNL